MFRRPCLFSNHFSRCSLKTLSIAATAMMAPYGAHAQTTLSDIVVSSSSRTELEARKVGSTVHVIDRQELEKHGQVFLKDYLARLPGISISQSGLGGTSRLVIRGATTRYIKVLIDGMDISDPSGVYTEAQMEHILVDDIERIEVLKGSQSTLYGGDAVAGVISITTRKAGKGLTLSATAEAGAYNTKRGHVTASYGTDKGGISFTAQGLDTDGFSAADENNGNTERDGYFNQTFSGKGHYRLFDNLEVFFAVRSMRNTLQYDNTFPTISDGNNIAVQDQQSGRVGAKLNLFDNKFQNTFAIQMMDIERQYTTGFGTTPFDAERLKFEYKGKYAFSDRYALVFGAEKEDTSAVPNNRPEISATQTGLYAEALLEPLDNLNLTAGLRQDRHNQFGTFNTYRLTGSYLLDSTQTRLFGSYGTGFMAPSLDNLYGSFEFLGTVTVYGNPNLTPEESRSWDIGIEQALLNKKLNLTATYFNLETQNAIAYVFPGYVNLPGTTERNGIELSAQAHVTDWLSASLAYTRTNTKRPDGTRLDRVPGQILALGADLKPLDKLTWNITAKFVRDTLEAGTPLDDYVLLNSKLSYQLNDSVNAYVRGVNLLDQEYQTTRGYGTSDRAFYAGVKIKLHAE